MVVKTDNSGSPTEWIPPPHPASVMSKREKNDSMRSAEGVLPHRSWWEIALGLSVSQEVRTNRKIPLDKVPQGFLLGDNFQHWRDHRPPGGPHMAVGSEFGYTLSRAAFINTRALRMLLFLCPKSSLPLLTARSLFYDHSPSNSSSTLLTRFSTKTFHTCTLLSNPGGAHLWEFGLWSIQKGYISLESSHGKM